MAYTVAEAAEAIGKSKAAIFRAIRKGKLSATRDTSRGVFLIDPSELRRAFPPEPAVSADTPRDTVTDTSRFAELQGRLADAHDQIADLRRRLDQREADHRQALDRLAEAQARITALLTDQRTPVVRADDAPTRPSRRWWWHERRQ